MILPLDSESRCSLFGLVTRLRAGKGRSRLSVLVRDKRLLFSSPNVQASSGALPLRSWSSFTGGKVAGVSGWPLLSADFKNEWSRSLLRLCALMRVEGHLCYSRFDATESEYWQHTSVCWQPAVFLSVLQCATIHIESTHRVCRQPAAVLSVPAKPSQSSNWGQSRKSTSPCLLAIPAFDRKAGLNNRHLNS